MTLSPPCAGASWAGNVQFMVLLPVCTLSSACSYKMSSSRRNYFYKSVKHLKDSHSNKKREGEEKREGRRKGPAPQLGSQSNEMWPWTLNPHPASEADF